LILQSLKSLLAESSSPATDGLAAEPQPQTDLGIRLALRRHQHHLGPQHLKMRPRVAGGDVLKRDPLGLAENHLVGATSGHLDSKFAAATTDSFNRDGISGRQH
jgi:hypothetical protein